MQFVYEIDDETVKSVEVYLANQVEQKPHPSTRENMLVRREGHESPEAFFRWILKRDIDTIVRAYPTGDRADKVAQMKKLETELKDAATVKPVA